MLIDTWANQAIAIDFDYFALLRARACVHGSTRSSRMQFECEQRTCLRSMLELVIEQQPPTDAPFKCVRTVLQTTAAALSNILAVKG